jgi:hypothetical protein
LHGDDSTFERKYDILDVGAGEAARQGRKGSKMDIEFDEVEEFKFGGIRVAVGRLYGKRDEADGSTSAGPIVYGAYFPADSDDGAAVPGAIGYGWGQAPAVAALFNGVNYL